MIYVTSDLHGFPLAAFQDMLRAAGFGPEDFLFVLGDVVDRGKEGIPLLRWMAQQPNIQLILGNHEAMLLSCDYLFREVSEESLADLSPEKLTLLHTWMENGGEFTLSALEKLLKEEPDILAGLLDYLHDAPLYDTVEAGGKNYILVHSGLGNFQPAKPLHSYTPDELLWARPTAGTQYFHDATVVFGHTPTEFLGGEPGKAFRTDSWICIDTGAAMGNRPMLLRLDDGREFY